MRIFKILSTLSCVGFTSVSLAASCLSGTMSFDGTASNYYAPIKLSITNNCSSAVNLDGTQVAFNNNGQPVSSAWGDYTAKNFSQNGFTLSSYSSSKRLGVGATATVKFGINLNNQAFNLQAANSSLAFDGAASGSSSGGSGGTTTPPSQVIETPPTAGCVTGTFSALSDANNKWYTGATLKIVNTCTTTVNLDGAAVSFSANATNVDGPWYPFKGANTSVKNGTTSFTLSAQSDSAKQLASKGSVNLQMGLYLNNQSFAVGTANATLRVTPVGSAAPTPNDGAINVTVNPAGMSNVASGASSNITISSNSLAQPIVINNTNFSTTSTYSKTGLNYATYSISADNPTGYSASVIPSTVNLSSSTPASVVVTYSPMAPAQTGVITVTMPVKPIGNLTDAGMTVNVIDTNRPASNASKFINFNQVGTFGNLPAGDIYNITLTPSNLSNGSQTATPTFSMNNFKLSANTTQNVNVSFQMATNPTSPVVFKVSGLTSATPKVNLNLTNLQGYRIGTLQLGNGNTTLQIPNNTYVGDADATPLLATMSPDNFTVPQTTTVTISAGAAPVYTAQLGAYWAGWMGYQYDLNGTYGNIPMSHVYLSFGNFVNNKVDTSVSGWFGDVPAANSQIQPAYQNWTTYAFNHPNAKMMLSLGGATFGAMWATLTNDQAASNMANAIISKLNTQYPVYAPSGSNPQVAFAINSSSPSTNTAYGNSRLLGYTQMNGVDFDVEVSGAAEMAKITPYLVKVMDAVHTALPNKTISVAVFSVGGDPVGACTVPGSAHCGEALPLINAVKADADLKNIVLYNVMAYDAGTDFVLATANNNNVPLYQKALQNYTNAVGNAQQVILGLDLQPQWGVAQPLTCPQLAAQAQWAYQHPNVTGGTFLWEIGDDAHNCKALPALQAMQAAMTQ